MPLLSSWFSYFKSKFCYSIYLTIAENNHGHYISRPTFLQVNQMALRFLLPGKLTFLHQNKAEGVAPAPPNGIKDGTFLVRRIPYAHPINTYVGDMVVLKDPMNSQKYLVRRIAGIEGDEIASTDEKDEPFVLGENECWVLADNEATKPESSYDSRSFGPVAMKNIVGRAIYILRNDGEHGPVNNSDMGMIDDKPVLEVELDIKEMKNHNNNNRQ